MVVDRIGCAGSNRLAAIAITMHCRLPLILRALVLSICLWRFGIVSSDLVDRSAVGSSSAVLEGC